MPEKRVVKVKNLVVNIPDARELVFRDDADRLNLYKINPKATTISEYGLGLDPFDIRFEAAGTLNLPIAPAKDSDYYTTITAVVEATEFSANFVSGNRSVLVSIKSWKYDEFVRHLINYLQNFGGVSHSRTEELLIEIMEQVVKYKGTDTSHIYTIDINEGRLDKMVLKIEPVPEEVIKELFYHIFIDRLYIIPAKNEEQNNVDPQKKGKEHPTASE